MKLVTQRRSLWQESVLHSLCIAFHSPWDSAPVLGAPSRLHSRQSALPPPTRRRVWDCAISRWPSPLPACSDARLAPERPPLLGASGTRSCPCRLCLSLASAALLLPPLQGRRGMEDDAGLRTQRPVGACESGRSGSLAHLRASAGRRAAGGVLVCGRRQRAAGLVSAAIQSFDKENEHELHRGVKFKRDSARLE